MKEFLFGFIIILLTPIYLYIKFTKKVIEIIADLTQPIADGLEIFFNNMCEFWKKIFKIKEEK
jgi:hypothetical protein|nr:MAG TPA: hypothetical protein [Caudoviricetes sp.]